MKTPIELAKTIYLGDRACKRVIFDGWEKAISLQIDCISRIRSSSGQWDYYVDEDIEDGLLVFEGVDSFHLEPQGLMPNDWVEIVDVSRGKSSSDEESPGYVATLSLGAVDSEGNGNEVALVVKAASLHLADPTRPGVKIHD